jgi:hypothetical protein
MSSWFHDLLREELEKHGGVVVRLEEAWGIDRTVIDRWLRGSEPRRPHIDKVLQAVGGDPRRALPARGNGEEINRANAAARLENQRLQGEVNALKERNVQLENVLRRIRVLTQEAVPEQVPKKPLSLFRTAHGAYTLSEGGPDADSEIGEKD